MGHQSKRSNYLSRMTVNVHSDVQVPSPPVHVCVGNFGNNKGLVVTVDDTGLNFSCTT
jgi:hypothetical protein